MKSEDIGRMVNHLDYLGFPKTHEQEIKDKISSDPGKFEIDGKVKFPNYAKEKDMDYTIYFKKFERQDMYHPYMYRAEFEGEQRSQMFRIVEDAAFTTRDAFNLLNGRAVHKMVIDHSDRKMKPFWFKLDLSAKDVHGNYPVNRISVPAHELVIATQLEKQNVEEMKNPLKRVNIILSLYQGNTEAVTIPRQSGKETVYAMVDPLQKSVRLYSGEGKEIDKAKSMSHDRVKDQPVKSTLTLDHDLRIRKRKGKSL